MSRFGVSWDWSVCVGVHLVFKRGRFVLAFAGGICSSVCRVPEDTGGKVLTVAGRNPLMGARDRYWGSYGRNGSSWGSRRWSGNGGRGRFAGTANNLNVPLEVWVNLGGSFYFMRSLVLFLDSGWTTVPLWWTYFEGTWIHLARVFLSLADIYHHGTENFLSLWETISPVGTGVYFIEACGMATGDLWELVRFPWPSVFLVKISLRHRCTSFSSRGTFATLGHLCVPLCPPVSMSLLSCRLQTSVAAYPSAPSSTLPQQPLYAVLCSIQFLCGMGDPVQLKKQSIESWEDSAERCLHLSSLFPALASNYHPKA